MNKLQKALCTNSIFSGISGLGLVFFNKNIAELFGINETTVFWIIGLALIYFSLTILIEVKKQRAIAVMWIIIQDFLWVIGSVYLLIADPFKISNTGNILISIISLIVLFMGVNQSLALANMDSIGQKPKKRLAFKRVINANKSTIWKVISDVGNYHQVAPNIDHSKIISGQEVGMVRSCSHGKDVWTETCSIWEEEKTYSFVVDTSALDYPYPLSFLQGTWNVNQINSHQSEIEMIFELTYKKKIFNLFLHPIVKMKFNKACKELLDNWQKRIEMKSRIPAKFPFESKFVDIFESTIHYIDIGKETINGSTFLFIHGNPTSSYLWRNIIPYVCPLGRTIALDLIGFGKSGKPNINYTFEDHIKYLNEFIQKVELKNIILIVHDWGGALGFNYAASHSENVKGIVFMETFAKPMEWDDLDFLARYLFKKFRDPIKGQKWNGKYNIFLRFILQASMNKKLSKQEKQEYLEPFKTVESRKPIVLFPQELPFKGEGTRNEEIALEYFTWLKESSIPKLLLYANPGVQIQKRQVEYYKKHFENIDAVFIGKGKHYIQEDQPDNIGAEIVKWYKSNI